MCSRWIFWLTHVQLSFSVCGLFTIYLGKPRVVHGLLSSFVSKQNSELLNFVPELLLPLLFVQLVPVTEKLLRRLENGIKDGLKKCLEEMESRANFHLEHSVQKNRTTFSDVPLLPGIFRWNVQKSRLPFNFQPDFPQSVWMVNNRSVELHCGTVLGDKFWPQSVTRYFHIPIIHLVYPPRVLNKHSFQFLLGFTILRRAQEN